MLLFFLGFCSLEINAQSTKAVLFFKNGSQLSGYGKVKGLDKVKYRETRDSKPKKYSFKILDRIEIQENGENPSIYVQELVIGEEKPKVMELLEIGKINLYITMVNGSNPGAIGSNIRSYNYTLVDYYIKKEGERATFSLKSSELYRKDFNKAATLLFKECPNLVAKIEAEEYNPRDIREMIVFYNKQCD